MSTRQKVIGIIIGILVVVVIIFSFTKNIIVKSLVEKGVERVTGLQLNLKSFKVGIINTLIDIKDLRLFNSPGYEDAIMLEIPEIYINYDLPAILKGRVHLEEMRINLKEFTVVKNKEGELNLNSLKAVQTQKESDKPEEGKEKKGEGKRRAPKMQIDKLELKIGKVVYKDYSREGAPLVKEFNVNFEGKYTNVIDPYSLVSLIILKALRDAAITNIIGFDSEELQEMLPGTLETTQKIGREDVKKTGKELKKLFKSPFDSKEEEKK